MNEVSAPHQLLTGTFNQCLPDQRRSCAACCGLYNVKHGTKERLSITTNTTNDHEHEAAFGGFRIGS